MFKVLEINLFLFKTRGKMQMQYTLLHTANMCLYVENVRDCTHAQYEIVLSNAQNTHIAVQTEKNEQIKDDLIQV